MTPEALPRRPSSTAPCLFLFLLLMGAARAEEIATPAEAGSFTPSLVAGSDGIYLSWLQSFPEGQALRFARWGGSDWGPVRTIHTSDRFFANWADFASLAVLSDGRLVAHWLERAGGRTYEYDIFVAISDDGGESFGAPEHPHRDGTLSEHGFVSLVPRGARGFAAVWLDGRQFVADGGGANEMALVFTTHDGERFEEERILDRRVCECCQTSMAATRDGLFVAYRDRSAEEIRDIGVVRFDESSGRWSESGRLHDDGWELPGCPVNGPQVASRGERLAVAWFTGEGERPRVQIKLSEDSGETFGPPLRLDGGEPLGRVDVELVGDRVAVSWLERVKDGRADVKVALVNEEGKVTFDERVARTSAARSSGFPRMASYRGDLYLAWTEASSKDVPLQVRLLRLTSPSEVGAGTSKSDLR